MFFSELWQQVLEWLGALWRAVWWFLLFLFSIPFAKGAWLSWRQQVFDQSQKYKIFEIKIPREVTRSARAMEQVFQAVSQMANGPGNFSEKYLQGEICRTFSFEMVSFSGEVHFYCRVYHKYKTLIEAAFYSAYPDLELVEVEDYTNKLPPTYADLSAQGFDLWASEMTLAKPPMYPIKTYRDFETPDEDAQFDPMAVFVEMLSKCKPGEFLGIQYLLVPIGSGWAKEYEAELEKLKSPKFEKRPGADEKAFPIMTLKSPGETDVIKAIENKFSKNAFEAVVRFVYISPKTTFYDSFVRRSLPGAFNQYGSNDLNSFKINVKYSTQAMIWYYPYLFSKTRNRLRKERQFAHFRQRYTKPNKKIGRLLDTHPLNWLNLSTSMILTVDELATLFHPPSRLVLTAPHIERVVSKKGGPPAGAPIYGEEEELAEFMNSKE